MKRIVLLLGLLLFLVGCAPALSEVLPEVSPIPSPIETPQAGGEAPPTSQSGGLPNPASKYCVDQGYELEIRTDESGNQYGVCIFPDGSECEEWAFFRGECTYEEQ